MSPPKLFISYSHLDKRWFDQLFVHMRALQQQKKIASWTDQTISAGAVWREEIEKALREADIAVLLVTPAFFASEFIHNVELPELMQKRVVWVAVATSIYRHTPIAALQCANDPARPLSRIRGDYLNEAWVNVCDEILKVAAGLPGSPETAAPERSIPAEILHASPENEPAAATPSRTSLSRLSRKQAENASPRPIVPLPVLLQPGGVKNNPLDGSERVWIPAGTFQMGSDRYSREQPVHTVRIEGFWMQRTAVTVGQYETFVGAMRDMGESMADHAAEMPAAPASNPEWRLKDHPMVNISWLDAQAYCKWAQMRLPTEAEWEYASRGGLEGKEYPWGDDWDGSKCVNSVGESNPGDTQSVGKYPANGYGLYDMSGNVWEWCADWFDAAYYQSSPSDNPKGPTSGNVRVVRGGSWENGIQYFFRCACRLNFHPDSRFNNLGFRCCASGL